MPLLLLLLGPLAQPCRLQLVPPTLLLLLVLPREGPLPPQLLLLLLPLQQQQLVAVPAALVPQLPLPLQIAAHTAHTP